MTKSSQQTVAGYLAELPPERREVVSAVRRAVRAKLPKGYAEAMNWGMISYEVPLKAFPETYNGQPLLYAAIAAQKNNYAIYLMSVYGSEALAKRLKDAFVGIGKKPDMGKSCIRFKKLEDIPLAEIADIVGVVPMDRWIEIAKQSRQKKQTRAK